MNSKLGVLTAIGVCATLQACSQSSPVAPDRVGAASRPGIVTAYVASDDGEVGGNSATVDRIRVTLPSRQFYAAQGGVYGTVSGAAVEIWVEGKVDTGAVPRLIIDWGDGVVDFTGCGSCKLSHIYSGVTRRQVSVTLDDKVSAFSKTTFSFDVGPSSGSNLRIVFGVPANNVGPLNTFLEYRADAFANSDLPVTLNCTLNFNNFATYSTPTVPTVNATGRANFGYGFLVSVALSGPFPVTQTCTATAGTETVNETRTVILN